MGWVRPIVERDPVRAVMALLWGGFTVAYLAFFYLFQDASEIAEASLDGYLEVILLAIPSVVLLAGVVWLGETDVDRGLRPRVIGWTVGIALLFTVAMYTALFVIESRFDPGEQWLILLLSSGFGGSAGTAMGILEVRSKQRERERDRSLVVASHVERERRKLEHLNQYLRHEVLNEANKISGYAELVSDRTDEDVTADYAEIVRRSSDEIAVFIESIRTILDSDDHSPELVPVDVTETLRREAAGIERRYPETTVTVEGSASARILAGDLLDRVFRNLIENAIEHNRRGVTVNATVEAGDEWVRVRLRDDGSGIDDDDREALFEPPESGDHGYGLFLTRNLVEVYGGRIELSETGPDGTEIVVRFLPASADRPDQDPRPVRTV
jgi:signal transduction histidine kinase